MAAGEKWMKLWIKAKAAVFHELLINSLILAWLLFLRYDLDSAIFAARHTHTKMIICGQWHHDTLTFWCLTQIPLAFCTDVQPQVPWSGWWKLIKYLLSFKTRVFLNKKQWQKQWAELLLAKPIWLIIIKLESVVNNFFSVTEKLHGARGVSSKLRFFYNEHILWCHNNPFSLGIGMQVQKGGMSCGIIMYISIFACHVLPP